MTEEKARKLRLIYATALGVFTVIVGALFIMQTLRIYGMGDKPFSREIVAEKLSQIAIPVFLWIAAIIAGGIIWTVFPPEKKRLIASFSPTKTLKKLKGQLPETGVCKVSKNELILRIVWGVCIIFAAVTVIIAVIFLSKIEKTEITQNVLQIIARIGPFVLATFALVIGALIYTDINAKMQIKEVKAIIAENAKAGVIVKRRTEEKKKTWYSFIYEKHFKLAIQIAVGAIAVTFIVLGVFNGGAKDVLLKAIKICMECVGLG